MQFPKATEMSHQLIAKRLRRKQVAIDATSGNGYDTVFLAERVGAEGKVFAIDIQGDAVEATRKRLEESELLACCTLIEANHEDLPKLIPAEYHGKVRAIMFNLGYLPGSDKVVKTNWQSSLTAIRSSLDLLGKGGILTVCVYPGHAEGKEEAIAMERFAEWLDPNQFCSAQYRFLNLKNDPPFLLAIEKER